MFQKIMLGYGSAVRRNNPSFEATLTKRQKMLFWSMKNSNLRIYRLKAKLPLTRHRAVTLALKAQNESFGISGGKTFQSQTGLGKKDIFLRSVLQLIVRNVLLCLVLLLGGINLLPFLIATISLSVLNRYRMVSMVGVHRNQSHPKLPHAIFRAKNI